MNKNNEKIIIDKQYLQSLLKKQNLCKLNTNLALIGKIIGSSVTLIGAATKSKNVMCAGLIISATSLLGHIAARKAKEKNQQQLKNLTNKNMIIMDEENNQKQDNTIQDNGYNFDIGM
ncbi:MAG: hypothetical protein J6A28_00370 [Clostridia bacterium]|nr:hypothetical protein [Clostridia bacterium]